MLDGLRLELLKTGENRFDAKKLQRSRGRHEQFAIRRLKEPVRLGIVEWILLWPEDELLE